MLLDNIRTFSSLYNNIDFYMCVDFSTNNNRGTLLLLHSSETYQQQPAKLIQIANVYRNENTNLKRTVIVSYSQSPER